MEFNLVLCDSLEGWDGVGDREIQGGQIYVYLCQVCVVVRRTTQQCKAIILQLGFPGVARGKYPPANTGEARDIGSVPELGRSPGGGHGNPLQYFCLENPMDRGAWWATVYRVAKNQT